MLASMFSIQAAVNPTMPMQALVISNSNYASKPLANPRGDAELMSETLKQLGFNVKQVSDLNRKSFYSDVRTFYEQLPEGSVALIYYAGHGVQIGGANYLIPTDMALTSERGVEINAYPLKAMLNGLENARSSVNIVVLDACRNNPFQPNTPSKYRSLSQMGLAKVTTPKGTFVAYSTAPGQLAADGQGGTHSLYTATLADEMRKSGASVETVFKQVADIVRKKTYDDQQPWYESSLIDNFYFIPPAEVQMVAAKTVKHPSGLTTQGSSRSVESKKLNTNNDWYLQLNESEWSQFDWEVTQRVKRMTEDEIPLLLHRAKAGNVVAQTTLGVVYREGLKKIVDYDSGKTYRSGANNTKSLQWLTKAAKAGFPMAQTELGEMFYEGHGVDRNLDESIHWLELASSVNYPRPKLDLVQAKSVRDPSPESIQAVGKEVFQNVFKVMKQSQ
ncbi:MAG: caspase family protein [Methylotenera sp.]